MHLITEKKEQSFQGLLQQLRYSAMMNNRNEKFSFSKSQQKIWRQKETLHVQPEELRLSNEKFCRISQEFRFKSVLAAFEKYLIFGTKIQIVKF